MKTKLYIFIILFLGCSYSPWETPNTITGKNAKSEINQSVYFANAMESSATGLTKTRYRTLCGQELPSILGVNFPESWKIKNCINWIQSKIAKIRFDFTRF